MHRHKGRQVRRTATSNRQTAHVEIRVLGTFEVSVDDAVTPERGWTRRMAASLVKVLALAPGHRLHREQVIDLLWPDESLAGAAPKLHKAAHYARKAAGRRDAVVLRSDMVLLFPAATVTVDVDVFDELSRRAIAGGDPATARLAIDHYPGELLPSDLYEEWAGERRELLRFRYLNLLRLTGRWLELSELEPEHTEPELTCGRDARDDSCTPRPASLIGAHSTVPGREFEALVAELAELTRRQAVLLERLATAAPAADCEATTGVAA
jgi:two-component SAPR family response regulator